MYTNCQKEVTDREKVWQLEYCSYTYPFSLIELSTQFLLKRLRKPCTDTDIYTEQEHKLLWISVLTEK